MRHRFFNAAILSIVIGLLTAFVFAVPLIDQIFTDETENRLSTALTLVAGTPLPDTAAPYQTLAEQTGGSLAQAGQPLRITVIASDGTVLGDSTAQPGDMSNHADRPEVKKALVDGTGRNIRRSATTGHREMYQAMRATLADGTVVVYRASLALDGAQNAHRVLWGCGIVGVFAGLVGALFVARYASARVVRPLQQLTVAARELAEGTMVQVEDAPNELGELSGAFNRMSRRLADARADLEQNNRRMAGILQGLDDGVAAIDADGHIVLLTHRAEELLGKVPSPALRLTDCGVNYRAVQELMEQVTATGLPVRDTLVVSSPSERVLQVYAAPVSGTEDAAGALAVVSDITRLRRLETLRSEFVANVTHELKTPLTSIRGYIELLREPRDAKTAQSFYDIIEIETDRLQKLTDDLLQLSEIESGARGDDQAVASVVEVVSPIAESLLPEAQARGITIRIAVPDELRVAAAPRRLHQLMKNLMENAVKYNLPDGTVDVTASTERGVAVIRVQDSGIGIPSEHQDRIFERFYRVDKGRSRELGGTGLGLSIAKHIVGLYGGDIRVSSTPDKGSVFTVRLPLA